METTESPMLIIVMVTQANLVLSIQVLLTHLSVQGVSGTGKSTLGTSLSTALHLPYVDGDDLHPAPNIAKMSKGEALNDADRAPWLKIVRDTGVRLVGEGGGAVLACSALKKSYRQVLRGEGGGASGVETYFVWIKGERSVLLERMEKRQGHYMKASMLDSQLESFESPEGEENVVVVPLDLSPAEQLVLARDGLRKLAKAPV